MMHSSYNQLGWGEAKRSLSLGEVASRASQYKWLESKAFEISGAAVLSVVEPELKLMLNRHSLHHGWHAELWHNHIPETPAFNPTRQALAPSQNVEDFMATLAGTLDSDVSSATKLVGIYRVLLPYMVTSYNSWAYTVSPVSEAPMARSLRLVLQDKVHDWQEGEAAIQTLVSTSSELAKITELQLRLESILLSSGGLVASKGLYF